MTWLVFAVSCLLVLAGAVSIISGAPIIQIERGWAEVIAGTMALSSGGVVFALAAILMRLESVRRAITENRPILTPAVQAVAEPTEEVVPPPETRFETPSAEPTTLQPAPAVEPDTTGDDGQERHGLWKRVRRPAEADSDVFGVEATTVPASVEQAHPPSSVLPASEPSIDHGSSMSPAMELDDGSQEGDGKSDGSLSWLDRSLFKPRQRVVSPRRGAEPAEPSDVPATLPGSEKRLQSGTPGLESHPAPVFGDQTVGAETAGAAQHPAEPSDAERVVDETEPVPTDEVTVVGRYQAGVASYVMYSDGTIEVETQGGELHRFASMEELKGYIAQQDSPVV